MMMTAIVVITDGRQNCMERTMASLTEAWGDHPVDEILIVNDAADPEYTYWLRQTYTECDQVHHERRLGFGGAIRSAWEHVGFFDYIAHIEDDFIFNEPIDVDGMIHVLEARPDVLQMALKRQPWNDEERAAGGFMEQYPEDYHNEETDGYRWCWQRRFYTTNPSIYRGSLTERGWPDCEHSEGVFSLDIVNLDSLAKFGFWGHMEDPPRVHHIGDERIGTGY